MSRKKLAPPDKQFSNSDEASPPQTRSLDTKLELLLAAEQLFALNGLLGVSMRQIVSASNQRNASTIHYHFGSRDALIYAICEYRILSIEQDRARRLAEYLQSPDRGSKRVIALLEALLWPSAQPIIDSHGQSYFRRFLAHSFVSDTVDLPGFIKGRFDAGMRQIAGLLQQHLTHLSEASFHIRWALMIRSVTYLLANLEARAEATSKSKAAALIKRGVNDIAVSFAGMLQAPEQEPNVTDVPLIKKSTTKKK
ncbi:TetR family transcriptional regulator [Jezberella montanilacus]|jgi:AcrR family transcriptional regulator|uniref:TetR family transcriptional regulator n=1 Tax=Jezberella montanilacus TaxID=323426 RepID=A0A2T0XF62_9BURK|nr:TetR/AcrR family transcriptional regulator [Jezberella montanilacus]PRY97588.1 TetR family transcriptional regulator [Jezberella montanilacus]